MSLLLVHWCMLTGQQTVSQAIFKNQAVLTCSGNIWMANKAGQHLDQEVAGVLGQVDQRGGAASARQLIQLCSPRPPQPWMHLRMMSIRVSLRADGFMSNEGFIVTSP